MAARMASWHERGRVTASASPSEARRISEADVWQRRFAKEQIQGPWIPVQHRALKRWASGAHFVSSPLRSKGASFNVWLATPQKKAEAGKAKR